MYQNSGNQDKDNSQTYTKSDNPDKDNIKTHIMRDKESLIQDI